MAVELVIKISERDYDLACKYPDALIATYAHYIKDGTPLPKGHGRLIDADEIQFENSEFDTYSDYSRAFDAIDQADTIIDEYKEQKNNGFFDEIMDDELEDEETYEKIKEIIDKVKEQEE